MEFRNLQAFIAELRRRKDLIEIPCEVDPHLEIAEIHRRVIAAGGPALLFSKVRGKAFPVVTNLFGSKDRVDLAFGNRPKDLVKTIAQLPEHLLPPTLRKVWGLREVAKDMLRVGFKKSVRPPVMAQQVPGANLNALPAITSWSEDGGPFLTLPLVHTASPGKKPENLGMYRIQIFDRGETGMHFQIGKGGGFHLAAAEALHQPLATNIYLGGPPALILSAIAPLPENVPELMLASLVAGHRLQRGEACPNGIAPIAEAEFCLSGHVPPHVRRPEGPFGDHYGYYSLIHDYPVFRPQAIYHRPGAIFPATVVGKPRQEDFFLGDYLQELLFPMIPVVMPAVRDLWSYGETGYHALAAAVLHERYGRESMASAFRILGEGQLALTKFLLCLDQGVNLRSFKTVLPHVLERVDPRRDLYVFSELAMDTLDYTTKTINKGSKGVMLGMGEPKRILPHEFRGTLPSELCRRVQVFCPGCLVIEGPAFDVDPSAVAKIAALEALRAWPLVVVVDNVAKAVATEAAFLWTTFTRFEPGADIYSASTQLLQHHVSYEFPIVIDARLKPWFPKELFCDEATKRLVSERWQQYFPDRRVAMGSSDDAHLYQ